MNIWIINQYASLPNTGIGGRHRHLARELSLLGHSVTVVAASWTHLELVELSEKPPKEEIFEGFRFVRVQVSKYKDAHAKRRLWNWVAFGFKISTINRRIGETPDVILYSSPSLLGYLGAEVLARRMHAPLIFEVRDFWPESLQEIGGFSAKHPFIRLLSWVERRAMRRCVRFISNTPKAGKRLLELGIDQKKFTWIPNGVSLPEIQDRKAVETQFVEAFPKTGFVVCYTGTLGAANSLDILLDTAEILKDQADISFALVGRGRETSNLKKEIARRGISSIHFLGPVEKKQVQSAIAMSDACFIAWKKSPLYRYGIAANKLYDYMFSGKPILHCYSGNGDPITENKAGITVDAESPRALADAIVQLRDLSPEARATLGENGRRAAIQNYDYKKIAKRLETCLIDASSDEITK